MTEAVSGLENKAGQGVDEMFDTFMRGFEEFKRTNDGRIKELEKRGGADVVTEQKVERLKLMTTLSAATSDRYVSSLKSL